MYLASLLVDSSSNIVRITGESTDSSSASRVVSSRVYASTKEGQQGIRDGRTRPSMRLR